MEPTSKAQLTRLFFKKAYTKHLLRYRMGKGEILDRESRREIRLSSDQQNKKRRKK